MTYLSNRILEKWQVRKTAKQKQAFLDFMKEHIPNARVEEGGFVNSRNLVIGDVASADVILTAHYDTCARLPFPNFITPKNILLYILYQLLILIPFFALFGGCIWLFAKLGLDVQIGLWLSYLIFMGTMFGVLMMGPANKHTANDNTSGVITLCEIYLNMTPEQRAKTCFVFFDNEENGLLGSAQFKKLHKKDGIDNKLLINFDCVSDGDNLMLVLSKKADKRYRELFARHYQPRGSKAVLLEKDGSAFYPSDQKNFALGVGVAALKHKKVLGYYMDKIHTKHDTNFDPENIELLRLCTCSLIDEL